MRERKSSTNFFKLLSAAALCAAFCVSAIAQSTATLQGTVTDPQGAVVPNAKLTVRSLATGAERTAQTDADGNYQVASLQPGDYRVEVQAQGFQTQVVATLDLEVARTVAQNFQLTVGSVSQEVTVTSDTSVVETATTSVGTVINQRTVQEIPLNGRHFVDLGLLIPGSVTPPQNGFLTAPLRGQGSFAINTAGNREDTVNFQINGVNLNDMVQNQITFQPSINTVSEFKADNSTFSAEYGRNSGAVVNIATRSGTNAFHGELFEFLRNEALDARNFFDAKKPPFKRNQFGFAIGGPVLLPHFGEGGRAIGYDGKNRTFFFFSYEGLRQRQGLTLNTDVLSDAQRASASDPTTRRLLDLIPRANAAGANGSPRFVGSGTAPVNIDQGTIDLTHNLGANDRLHGYYALQRDFRGEPTLQGNSIPNFGDTRQSRRQILTVNETHTFGSNLVNEARFGYNRIHITFTPNALLNPADFGIRNGVTQPIGLPQISISGSSLNFGGPAGFPQGRGDTTFVLSDTMSYLRGAHSFKFGGEFRRFLNNNFALDPGTFGFANVAAFLSGTISTFTVTLADAGSNNVTNSISQGALGLFAQDNYKLRPNLTLELGLRYDWNMSPTERFDRFVNFDPVTDRLIRVNQGLAPVYETNAKNLQPRVGFAYDPWGDGKTSIRGAYAVLVDQPITNLVTGLASNPPFANPVSLPAGRTTTFATANTDARAAGSLAPNATDLGFDNAYIQSWNLNVQREVGRGFGVTAGYFGSKGTHLRLTRNLNQLLPNGSRPFTALSASSPIAPGVALANITEREGTGNSSYNALWLTAQKRLSRGLQFNTSYTLSKSIDYNSQSSQGVTVQDSYNLRGDRGPSDFDARHRLVFSGLYELPFHGNRLVEGWELTTIVQSQSGNPINLLAGNAVAITGANAANANALTGLATLRPDLIGPVNIVGSPNQWFTNTVCDPRPGGSCPAGSAFALPVSVVGGRTFFHFGSLGRNVIVGPRFDNVDFSVIKNTRLSEDVRVQFRAEVFDLFNHANFGQPGRVAQPGSTTFGVITNTRFATGDSGSSRQIQFALKLLF
jgi:Carboxypeptidase regulatory-like domain